MMNLEAHLHAGGEEQLGFFRVCHLGKNGRMLRFLLGRGEAQGWGFLHIYEMTETKLQQDI